MGTGDGPAAKRLRSWLIGVVVVVAVCAGIGPFVWSTIVREALLGPSAEEGARDGILEEDAPAVARYIETADLDPADPGPAAEELLTGYFRDGGGVVLASSSVPGPAAPDVAAATVDVRMARTADSGLGSQAGPEQATATICLRFTVRWMYGADVTFQEIDCP